MIYLDHNATSPMPAQVLDGMVPFFAEHAGNPSSVHTVGRAARQGLDEARRRVAALLDVHYSQVIFTSGGTEANNTALLGIAEQHGFRGHMLVSAIEHPSILKVCERLQMRGMAVTQVAVDPQGRVDAEAVAASLREDTRLVSVMHANNETGVIQPLAEIGRVCRQAGVPLHSDAVQSAGKIAFDFASLEVDFLSLSAHKFGGPKGVGALIVDKHATFAPLLLGGGQERGLRSGTENIPGIVGFGLAAALAQSQQADVFVRLQALQQRLETGIQAAVPECVIFSQGSERLPNTTAVAVPGLDAETVVMSLDLDGFAISSGSACGSGRQKPSYVIHAMGYPDELAISMLRVSLGWQNSEQDVQRFVVGFKRVIKRLQSMALI